MEQDLTELSQHLPQEPDQAVTRGGRGVGQHLPQEADQAVTQEGGGVGEKSTSLSSEERGGLQD